MNLSFAARSNQETMDENYDSWCRDPSSVDPLWAAFFEGFTLGCSRENASPSTTSASSLTDPSWQTRVDSLVYAYRSLGHSIADLDPLGLPRSFPSGDSPPLSLEALGFSENDLDRPASSRFYKEGKTAPLRQIIHELELAYCGTLAAEFVHIQNPKLRSWVRDRMESRSHARRHDPLLHLSLLQQISDAEALERFLHSRYIGQKRFSLEGGESLLVALHTLLADCEKHGITEIVMGMAHRGRLNVLANFLRKPLSVVFEEFHDRFDPDLVGGNGDVKYHLGYQNTLALPSGHEVTIRLSANPSHLEAVNPVVQGKARARQRVLGDTAERKKVLPLLVHGDAAFIGQGIVQETLNLSQLPGYKTGGTVHLVANNQIGFTTLPADARSTPYCTDAAKMIEAPIFHANGDDPIAVFEATEMALAFRQEFGRDAVVDIFCYRRHGHSEGDEPTFTQPDLYRKIQSHPLLSESFALRCISSQTISQETAAEIRAASQQEIESAFAQQKKNRAANAKIAFSESTALAQPPYSHAPIPTAISREMLAHIAKTLTSLPEGFSPQPKLKRTLLDRRTNAWKNGGPYDWAFAEALAFGSLLLEGIPVRLSGQDSRRGTFSQRHTVLYDEKSRNQFVPLACLSPDQASFCAYNSPLSEYAVLGFDFGYSMDFPQMLCIWEAQFGDFANGAQIIIDQFIASSEAKWGRPSSIVLLLPHGYDGQGPEHSSARLERFLQLCAEDNLQICTPSTPAQYFHALRRQTRASSRKPLVLLSPKNLLRSDLAVSSESDFTSGHFEPFLAPPLNSSTERLILCSGKIYYDLLQHLAEHPEDASTPILRIEQLYPFDSKKLTGITASALGWGTKIVWCQEEPQNMGAWQFLLPRLQEIFGREIHYAGRPPSASPAVGSLQLHRSQQTEVARNAFSI